MASATRISKRGVRDNEWTVVEDLMAYGSSNGADWPKFRSITRLAISPDHKWLAFVAEPASAK